MRNVDMDYKNYLLGLSCDYSTPYLTLGDLKCLDDYKALFLNNKEQRELKNVLDNVATIYSESINFKRETVSNECVYVSFYKSFKEVLFVKLLNIILKCDKFSSKDICNIIVEDYTLSQISSKLDFVKVTELKKAINNFLNLPSLNSFIDSTMIYGELNIFECLNFYNCDEFIAIYKCVKDLVDNEGLKDTAFTKEEFFRFINDPRHNKYFKLFLKSVQFVVNNDTSREAIGVANSSFNFYIFDAIGYEDIFSRGLHSFKKAPLLYDKFIEYLNKPGILNKYDLSIKSEFNAAIIEFMNLGGFGTNYNTLEYFSAYIYHKIFEGVTLNKNKVSYLDIIRRK